METTEMSNCLVRLNVKISCLLHLIRIGYNRWNVDFGPFNFKEHRKYNTHLDRFDLTKRITILECH